MICNHCKSEIDADSCFCDQCGKQVFVCPKCGIAGKGEGKRCGQCGTPLVAGGSNVSHAQTNQSSPSNQAAHTSAPQREPEPTPRAQTTWQQSNSNNNEPQASTTGPTRPTRLVCQAEGVALVLTDGALIGRVEGPYAPQLSRLKFISARHATITAKGSNWIITDVGSRNGTMVNGQLCYSPLPFKMGDIVRIGNAYDFIAE